MAATIFYLPVEPYDFYTVVTPDDDADLVFGPCEAIRANNDVAVILVDGTEVTFGDLALNGVIEAPVRRVLSTGTTATNVVALYRR